jgi:FkbM family methyltransferase
MTRLIMALGGGRAIDVVFRDATFRITGARNLMEQGILLHPRYNQADLDFLAPAVKDAIFVDVGSNIGLYALPLAKLAARVVTIDANPRMAALLSRNAALSGLGNVTTLVSAVSDKAGRADLLVRKDDEAIVRIEEHATGAIDVNTLEDLLAGAGVGPIGGLKIDIEGHEDQALAPFLRAAPDALLPLRIVIEHDNGRDYPGCAAAFLARGYDRVGRSRNNSFYQLRQRKAPV